jgi:hypothetical protein
MQTDEPQTIANQSPDSVHLRDGSISNSARAIINDKSKGYILGTLLALSILVNVLSLWALDNHAKEHRLQQYDLDDFKSRGFADLKGQVEMHDKLINTLLVRKECLK